MAKDVSKLKIVNDNTEYLFKDLLARNNISSLLGSGVLTSLTLNTFFAAPSNKDGLPLFRKITASDLPVLNQDTTGIASYAKYLRGRQSDGTYYGSLASNNIIAEWNTKSDNRWYLKAAKTYECRVDYATTSEKVKGTLKFGSKSFNGSSDVTLLGSDLNSVDLTSELTIIGLKTFSGETYLDSFTANSGIIKGPLRVINKITGELIGNASTASNVAWSGVINRPTNLSAFTDDLGSSPVHTHSLYLTSHQSLEGRLYTSLVSVSLNENTDWAKTTAKTIRKGFIYNTNNTEWSYLFGLSTSGENPIYGAILRMGYADKYLRILRVYTGNWQSTDWEKISAGYADSAGVATNVAWTGVTDKPSFATVATSGSYNDLSDKPNLSSLGGLPSTTKYAAGDSVGGSANYLRWEAAASSSYARKIPISWYNDTETTTTRFRATYYYALTYRTDTNTISANISGNAATASKVNGVIPEWSGNIAWVDTDYIAAWNSDGTKIRALSKSAFATAGHTHDYLPLSGGTLSSTANIVWANRGAWGNSSATYPYSYGGLYWNGTSDYIKIHGKEEASDLLNLWITFGDDSGHAIKIDDCGNVYTVYHTGNLSPMTTSHPANSITQTNINNWNAVHTWYTTATTSDTTNTIDTWKEIEAFVSSFNKGDNLATYLANNYLAKSGGTMKGSIYIPNSAPITYTTESSHNWIYISQLFTGSSASSTKYQAGIGWYNFGGDGNGALTLVPYAQNAEPWSNTVGLYITQSSLKFNGFTLLHSGNSSVSGNTININGTSTTWTDTKVTQYDTTTGNWRKLVLSALNGASTAAVSALTGEVYINANIECLPSTGTIKSTNLLSTSSISAGTTVTAGTTITAATSVTSTAGDFYVGGTSGSRCHIKMDTTNKCIKFIFD